MNEFKLYGYFIISYMKSIMEYRFAFFMDIFVNAFTYIVSFLTIWIMLHQFKSVAGWDYSQILFLYSINLLTYGIAGLFIWSPMVHLEEMIHTGTFDSVLIKPISPFKYLVFKGFQHTFLGHVIVALLLFFYCLGKIGIKWDVINILYLICVLIGSTIIHSSLMVIISSLSFWVVKTNTIFDIVIYNIRNFVNYPVNIYGKFVNILLTFFIPYAFVNYYPIKVLANDNLGIKNKAWEYLLPPLVSVLILILAKLIWKTGIKHYNSTGN